jgi:DMSO/TMAO reductase YedYZ heme-binding membrane subunit
MYRGKSKTFITAAIFIAVFTYAIVRYNVIKGVPWSDLPLFISNKAISLSAVAFIVLSYSLGSLARFWPGAFDTTLRFRKFFGLLGFGLAAIHALISLLIFTPSYYAKFFTESGSLNLIGELSMIFGVLAFFVFSLVAITSLPSISKTMDTKRWLAAQHVGYLGLVLVFLHVLVMGFEGWLRPESWPGGLLPISMVAAIIVALGLLVKIFAVIFASGKKR